MTDGGWRRFATETMKLTSEQVQKNQVGKRYLCTVCGSEMIVTKPGAEQQQPLTCDGQVMLPKA
jgi:hypothetical protein